MDLLTRQLSLIQRRAIVLHEFKQLGFGGIHAFRNVCLSVDGTFGFFELVWFYCNRCYDVQTLSKVEDVLETLKHE